MAVRRLREPVADVPGVDRSAGRGARVATGPTTAATAARGLSGALRVARSAPRLHLLLDYDGTLVPLAPTPSQAQADAALIRLVDRLASLPTLDVHIVSGRRREDLDTWFGAIDVSLWAEHGFWHRRRGARRWRALGRVSRDWTTDVLPVMESAAGRVPGAWVEHKSVSLVWHCRQSPADLAALAARRMKARLRPLLERFRLEALDGHDVVEVRPAGVGKAVVADWLARHSGRRDAIVALGDDRTDDELFERLPDGALTVSVGQALAHARYDVPDPRAVRRLLRGLLRPPATASSRPS